MSAVVTEKRNCDYRARGAWTWEQAVEWLRNQSDQQDLVRACYYDDPLINAAERFAESDEWRAVCKWLPSEPGHGLDIGAGRGISSFALGTRGWNVTALEPDPSPLVGTTAIRRLARESRLPIKVVQHSGEVLPFDEGTFDLVYGRQVLHHVHRLSDLCRESARVLKPGGRFVATREHVISRGSDLRAFLDSHPLHKFYGGENAYTLSEYTASIENAGMRLLCVLGPLDSVINYFPMTHAERNERCRRPLARLVGRWAAEHLTDERHAPGRWLLGCLAASRSRRDDTPGRLYSFIAEKTS